MSAGHDHPLTTRPASPTHAVGTSGTVGRRRVPRAVVPLDGGWFVVEGKLAGWRTAAADCNTVHHAPSISRWVTREAMTAEETQQGELWEV